MTGAGASIVYANLLKVGAARPGETADWDIARGRQETDTDGDTRGCGAFVTWEEPPNGDEVRDGSGGP